MPELAVTGKALYPVSSCNSDSVKVPTLNPLPSATTGRVIVTTLVVASYTAVAASALVNALGLTTLIVIPFVATPVVLVVNNTSPIVAFAAVAA